MHRRHVLTAVFRFNGLPRIGTLRTTENMIQNSLRVGFFTNMYRPFVGGVTRSIETFTHDLRKLGHHVYIFAPTFDGQEEETNVIRLPAIPKAANTSFSFPLPLNMKVRLHFENL